jgi:hypothetical protein
MDPAYPSGRQLVLVILTGDQGSATPQPAESTPPGEIEVQGAIRIILTVPQVVLAILTANVRGRRVPLPDVPPEISVTVTSDSSQKPPYPISLLVVARRA